MTFDDQQVSFLIKALFEFEQEGTGGATAREPFRVCHLLAKERFTVADCDRLLREASELGVIRTATMENPQSPFSIVAIELNRQHPLVQEVTGVRTPRPAFHPRPISGEPLSQTIIKERR